MDELLASLRAAGRTDSEGCFTVDLARALEKMERFQLANPEHYVLNLVAGAGAANPDVIELRSTSDSFQVQWDGPALTQEDMLALLDPFNASRSPTVRELARGLAASRALSPTVLEVESSQAYLQLDRACLIVEPRQTRLRNRVLVRLKRSLWQRLRTEDRSLSTLLAHHCRLATSRVVLNGRPLNTPLEPRPVHALTYLEGPEGTRLRTKVTPSDSCSFSALVALVPLPRLTAGLTVLHHQVSFELEDLDRAYAGAVVTLRAEGLEKELSQSTIVRGPALTAILDRVLLQLDKMAMELTSAQAPGHLDHLDDLARRLRSRLSDVELTGRNANLDAWTELAQTYWDIPFLWGVDGAPMCLSELVPGYVRRGYMPVTNKLQPQPVVMADGSPVLLRPSSGGMAELVDVFFPKQCAVHFSSEGPHLTDDFGLCPRLPRGRYLVRRFLTGVAGELGFAQEIQGPPLILTQVKGMIPEVLPGSFPLLPQGLVAIVRVSDGWDPGSLERAIAARLPEAYAALNWGKRHFPETERPLAEVHLREAARLGIKLWRKAGRPTPTPRDYLWRRMHEGGPEIRFIDPELLEDLAEDKTLRAYKGI